MGCYPSVEKENHEKPSRFFDVRSLHRLERRVALALVACNQDSAAATAAGTQPAQVRGGPHVDGNHFTIDATPTADCVAGSNCAIAIKLVAQPGGLPRQPAVPLQVHREPDPWGHVPRLRLGRPQRLHQDRRRLRHRRREDRHDDRQVQGGPEGRRIDRRHLQAPACAPPKTANSSSKTWRRTSRSK